MAKLEKYPNGDLKDQFVCSIRVDGECVGYVEVVDNKLVTNGRIGDNTYDDFVELIRGLQGHGIAVDNFYF